jgi:hypothetical protein
MNRNSCVCVCVWTRYNEEHQPFLKPSYSYKSHILRTCTQIAEKSRKPWLWSRQITFRAGDYWLSPNDTCRRFSQFLHKKQVSFLNQATTTSNPHFLLFQHGQFFPISSIIYFVEIALITQDKGKKIKQKWINLIRENSITTTSTYYIFNVATCFELSHLHAGGYNIHKRKRNNCK